MKKTTSPSSGGNAFTNLTKREQTLVMAMLGTFVVLALAVTIGLFHRSVGEVADETMRFQQSLDLLALAGPVYAKNNASPAPDKERMERFNNEALSNNSLKLTSFVATHAAATNITVSSYDEDQMPLGSKSKSDSGPVMIERQLRVDIRDANMDDLLEFMDRIEKSKEPVVVKRADLRALRSSEGKVRALIVISTYVRREQES